MAVTGNSGADRARGLLNGIPDRFQEFCKMDQLTFVDLADWLVEHADRRDPIPKEISVEECMFVFLDIAAQGSSFRMASYNWDHDVKLTQLIFLNMLEELCKLREKELWSPACPDFKQSRNRWRVLRGSRAGKSRMDGLIKIGDDRETGDGLEVNQEDLISALTAINNFIYEHHEFYS
ncbi:hypothetical protein DPSP01_013314 [Paraphaeosphaeria sporulosa]|uniref:DUF8040 domain-containing protein n=1 Tax=Paraphaeosphaeria sporulosa TaxID=1460663 RepID=A0A177CTH4_9PLEO|nr:uncharacterized protein CC84DRAFT_1161429 [Paraphaeosphaeria sporulosa]OAG10491.1 hypothetical protein CC84DRAFT_1161429 [Paraphaeosphaeria sporulosa]